MAFSFNNFNEYIQEHAEVDITPLINRGDTMTTFGKQTGVKTKAKLVIGGVDMVLQNGDASELDYAGGVSFSGKDIDVTNRVVKMLISPKELEKYFTQIALRPGTNQDDLPAIYQAAIISMVKDGLNERNEISLWSGDTTASTAVPATAYKADFDGFMTLALAAADSIGTGAAGVALTKATALAKVEELTDLIPSVKGLLGKKSVVAMSPANFAVFYGALFAEYKATVSIKDLNEGVQEVNIPGTNVVARSIPGLDGSNDMALSFAENFIVGCDLSGEEESIRVEWMPEAMKYRVVVDYKLGAQVGVTEQVIVTKA